MQSQSFTVITLEWINDLAQNPFPPRSGIYQIYGNSPIYGFKCLLYIGKAKNLQTRTHDHEIKGAISLINGKSYSYAECPEDQLTQVESILIATHKPSYNSQCINTPSNTDTPVMVQNHGERGALVLQVTNSHWL
jgi:excinuclease UvrABC nuclease subunit